MVGYEYFRLKRFFNTISIDIQVQRLLSLIYKLIIRFFRSINNVITNVITNLMFYFNNVSYVNIKSKGIPFISVARLGQMIIGKDFKINNCIYSNPIGRNTRSTLFVDNNALLEIGNNVGISNTAIICHCNIKIGDNVKIGGGVCIYDTDFHALMSTQRIDPDLDKKGKKNSPVIIGNNVFIGAHSTILKGVTIGNNSIIGAASVITKSIPENEIWAGNPAKYIGSSQ